MNKICFRSITGDTAKKTVPLHPIVEKTYQVTAIDRESFALTFFYRKSLLKLSKKSSTRDRSL